MEDSSNRVRYMTPSEAASLLMVSPVTLRHWALAGKLAFVTTPGGHRRFAEDELKRFAAQQNGGDIEHRILIVDDDVQLCEYLAELLHGLPEAISVEIANDGFEAGQKMHTFHPHTVLLDLMMPGMKGFDVCRKIKQNPETRDTRIIAMTGYHTLENMMEMMEVGAEACLAKPFEKELLLKTIGVGETAAMEKSA